MRISAQKIFPDDSHLEILSNNRFHELFGHFFAVQLHRNDSAFGDGETKILSQQYLDGPCGHMVSRNPDDTAGEVQSFRRRPLIKYYCLERI